MAIDDAQFSDHEEVSTMLGMTEHVVIERPMIYPDQRLWKGDPDDIVRLAMTVGCLINDCERRGCRVSTCRPADWKGQLKKDPTEARVISKLSDDEAELVELPSAESLEHNVIDAVGLGLWLVGRWRGTKAPPK